MHIVKTDFLKRIVSKLPGGTLPVVCACAILWLTLAPEPIGEEEIVLFPGADKLVHAIMFGGFALTLLIDLERKNGWKSLNDSTVWGAVWYSAAFGLLVECAQLLMGMGRSFEWTDFLADFAGAIVCGLLWSFFSRTR